MHISGLLRTTLYALALAILPLATGCSSPFSPDVDTRPPGLPPTTPLNDTPTNTMLRFEATYEFQVIAAYEELFTSNFLFTFSNQSDPLLVTEYGTSWGKDDEIESTSHLFDGFTNDAGQPQPPAIQIALTISGAQIIDDPFRPDSGAFYKYVIVPTVQLDLDMAGENDFTISAPHDFYLVRGDVAQLDPAQPATADRWYIYRWDDKSAALAARATRLSSLGSVSGGDTARLSWGQLKAAYVEAP